MLLTTPVRAQESTSEPAIRPILEVPNLTGLTLEEARQRLPEQLKVKVLLVIDQQHVGTVVRSSPASGKPLYREQPLLLFIGGEPLTEAIATNQRTADQGEPSRPWLLYLLLQASMLAFLYKVWRLK
jgi:hypothetical protein